MRWDNEAGVLRTSGHRTLEWVAIPFSRQILYQLSYQGNPGHKVLNQFSNLRLPGTFTEHLQCAGYYTQHFSSNLFYDPRSTNNYYSQIINEETSPPREYATYLKLTQEHMVGQGAEPAMSDSAVAAERSATQSLPLKPYSQTQAWTPGRIAEADFQQLA